MHSNALSRFILACSGFCFFASSAFSQGAYVPARSVNSNVNGVLRPVAGAFITVCAAGNANVPCAPPLAGVLFKDQALTQPLANPTTTDQNGNYPTMALAAGNYTITETAVGFTGFSYQITITCGTGGCSATTLTITGAAVLSGATTISNATMNCTIVNAVPCVDTANHAAWSGADACAWINSAQSSATGLSGAYGVIDARGLSGTITCAGTLAIGSPTQGVKLLLNNGVRLVVQNTVTVAQASAILGSSNSNGSVGTALTAIQAGASFPTSGVYLITAGPGSGVADAISVRDLFVDCAGVTGCKGILAQNIQENSDFTNITIAHNLGNGFDVTGTSEDFVVQAVNVVAGAAATNDNCFTQTGAANHIQYNTIGCTGQYAVTPSTGAGFLCTNCNAEIIGFHSEGHADQLSLSGASPNHGYVITNGLNSSLTANSVGMTNVIHVQSNWGGTLRASGTAKTIATNTIKNDESAFNHVCTDAVVNKYDLGWATGNPNAIQLDTDCSTLPTFRSATFAISGTTAGNFAPDATALFDIRGPSATFNGVRLTDTTSGNSYYFGPGAGVTTFGIRDQLNGKNLANFSGNASGGTLTLPTAGAATTAQVAGSVIPLIALTSQKGETGTADANVLTFTPPATAGTWRACVAISVSSATTGVISWTLSWTDSNGNAQANVAQPLFQFGTAAPNTTFTTSAAGNYEGCSMIDVNNAAASIIVKWVGGGTTAAKMSATIERLI